MASLYCGQSYEVQVVRDDGHLHVIRFDDRAVAEQRVERALQDMLDNPDLGVTLPVVQAIVLLIGRIYRVVA